MSQKSNFYLRVQLSNLESYVPGLTFPSQIKGEIFRAVVPQSLLFAEMDLFLFVPDEEGTILDIFPLFMFKTNEDSPPQIDDIKEVRLLGLFGRNCEVSLNTYVKGNAIILARN